MQYLNEILGIKYPFIQGGMANVATGAFAAAVSNAGALGIIGSGGMNAEKLEEHIRTCKSLTDKPFGVNLMLMNPDTPRMAELVAGSGVKVVTTGAGSPQKYVKMWKEAGILVIPVCASVLLAQQLVRAGADMIIAEGTESGGHVGEMTTLTLVPQMVDGVDVPVIAAGGIADGRQLAAAYALGAVGVQMGTCLLVSEECPIHDNYKNALLKAKDNGTCVTGRINGSPTRILKNRMARDYIRLEKQGAGQMELEKYTLGSLRKAVFDGNVDEGSLMAGQDCGQLKEIRPLKEIFRSLAEEASAVIRKQQETLRCLGGSES
jgi:enoyl-[acyl-carrier protein] reductase II